MGKILFTFLVFFITIQTIFYGEEILHKKHYQMLIAKTTEEILANLPDNHKKLARLYLFRGKNYLVINEKEDAFADFEKSDFELSLFCDEEFLMPVRSAFEKLMTYERLGMENEVKKALDSLQTLINHLSKDSDSASDRRLGEINILGFRKKT
jgi:hypothetical protein